MGRLPLCALVVALALPLTPSAAATPRQAPSDGHSSLIQHLPSAGIRSFASPGDPVSLFQQPIDLVTSSGDPRNPLTLARAEHRLLERTWGPSTDLRAALAGVAEGEAGSGSSDPDGRVRVPIASSDLDGDQNEDVVFFDIGIDENTFPVDVRLRALDGLTGGELWSKDYGLPWDLWVFSPGDLTGDSSDDLLVVEMDRAPDLNDIVCLPAVCAYDDTVTYRWDMNAISGPDGMSVWNRAYDGSIRYTGGYALQGPALTVVRHDEAVNALLDIRPSADLDGDGLTDFVVNRLGYRGEIINNQRVSSEDFDFSTTAEAITGDTGETLFSRSLADNPGAASLVPAGDATGDGKGDLLWIVPTESKTPTVCPVVTECTSIRSLELSVELIGGTGSTSKWITAFDDEGLVAGAVALTGRDLTGDGRADVILGLRFEDGSKRAVALSGNDGTRAWSFNTILTDPPSALGSIDGGTGSDVLFWEGWYPDPEEEPGVIFRIHLRRVDGATGEELFTTQHDLLDETDKVSTIFAYPVGDAGTDGVLDIALAVWHYSGSWIENGTASTTLGIESGADGTNLVQLQRDRKALLFAGGDWVPGGPLDLLEGSTTYNDLGFQLAGIEMPSGDTLWRRDDVLLTALFGSARRHSGGDDVVYGRTQDTEQTPRRRSRIDVLRGFTGVPLWGIGPTMDGPNP